MNYKLLSSSLLFTVALFVTSCAKEKCEQTNDKLIGTWQWVRSDGGLAFHIHDTPLSTGKNIELKITKHSYTITTNGVLNSSGTYTLSNQKCIHDQTNKTVIRFSESGEVLMIENLSSQNLEVSDEANDGIGSLYQRK